MDKELRKAVIADNWKVNKSPEETKTLLAEVIPLVRDAACKIVACTSPIDLPAAAEAAKGTNIKIGVQNYHWEESGAFIEEIAANVLTFIGIPYIITEHNGHRTYSSETNQTANQRIRAALGAGFSVILYVGEILERHEQGIMEELVALQIRTASLSITKGELARVIIAYEPIQTIGTGRTATSTQAGGACKTIHSVIAALYDKQTADAFTIQYGDSMNVRSATELLAQGDMDDGPIGGASLKAAGFAEIVRAASEGQPRLYRKGKLL